MTVRTLRLQRAARDERGIAMVTALLAITVASILGVTVMKQSFHTTQASAYDRARTQAIHAAEAGLDVTLSGYVAASSTALPCTVTGSLNATPVATYSVAISYYASFPLVGTPMRCSDPLPGFPPLLTGTVAPAGAALRSTGSVTGWPPGAIDRYMDTEVKLSAKYGVFNKAIFSDQTPSISGNITIYGENGNNADFLSNSNWTCSNSLTVYGSIIVQGTADLNNSCRAVVDLWANGNITMSSSARVDHDVKSSTGSLTMSQSASIGNSIVVGTTCSGCATRYGGTLTTRNPQPSLTASVFPPMTFDAASWTADGYSVQYFTDCTTARAWLTTSANNATKAVLRITGGCTLSIQNNTTITRTADLGIFTDGEITTNNNTTFQSGDSSWHNLYLIVESAATCVGTDPVSGTPNGRIVMSNQTGFDHEYFFVYSPCYSQFGQNNSSARGQIYGKVVAISNNLTYTFHAMFVPGAGDISGYQADEQFVREVN